MSDAAGSCIIDISTVNHYLDEVKRLTKRGQEEEGKRREGVRSRLTHHTIGVIIKADMS